QFNIESEAAPDKIESLLKLTERYCVVYQTLKNGVDVKTSLQKL
ncbi:MAG: OsmC family protein, partial [Chitinophagaceae bacterium]|nr:OsmC family protein [Chitinophagaceae bacterium]